MRKFTAATCFLLLTLLMSGLFSGGCVSRADAEKQVYDKVAANLQSGGALYSIRSFAPVKKFLEKQIDAFDRALAGADIPYPEKLKIKRISAFAGLFCALADVQNFTALGQSSVSRGQKCGVLPMSNTLFLAADPENKNLFADVFGKSNTPVKKRIGELPAECLFAAAADLRPEALMNILKNSGAAGEALLLELPSMPYQSILPEAAGWYQLFILPGASAAELSMVIEVPDGSGKLFQMLSAALTASGVSVRQGNAILPRKQDAPGLFIQALDGRMRVCFDRAAWDTLKDPALQRLADREEFASMIAGLPDDAVAAVYVQPAEMERQKKPFFSNFGKIVFEISADFGKVGMLVRKDDGWLYRENGSALDEQYAGLFTALPGLVTAVRNMYGASVPEKAPAEVKAKSPAQDKLWADCREVKLKAAAEAFRSFAAANKGKLPQEPGLKGLQKILDSGLLPVDVLICPQSRCTAAKGGKLSWKNCSYIYFGNAVGGGKIPLLIDRPDNHKNRFNVLYADGTVSSYELPRVGNCRRMISYLYTIHRWQEKVFLSLMKYASKIDRELKTER